MPVGGGSGRHTDRETDEGVPQYRHYASLDSGDAKTRGTSCDRRSMMPHATRAALISVMPTDPLVLLLLIGASAWVARLWVVDYRAALGGKPDDKHLPGATSAPALAVAVASLGAVLILAAETGGEHLLGLSAAQSKMTALFGLYSILGAPVIEEVLFRGYLVIENRGRAALWAGVVSVSMLFALLHPFLWEWKAEGLSVQFGAKAWFSTAVVFAVSVWFYTVRFFGLNPRRSLLPCLAAHAAKNLGVFAIKYVQGFVAGWW
jgi:CAAX protease family protein